MMPCDCSYMEATNLEKQLSQVACLLDELKGKKKINKDHWDGYHPKVYGRSVNGDKMVESLCSQLQHTDVSKHSLEMQIWWRDHQEADRVRVKRDIKKARDTKARKAALEKLTPYERNLLGVSHA